MSRSKHTPRRSDALRAAFGAALLVALSCAGCGRYFSAEVAGFVVDSDSRRGINDTVVRIYLEEPSGPDADGFIGETASVTSGGNTGYFSHRIIWFSPTPAFGDEGDSGQVWIGVVHDDYASAVVRVRGIISDDVNLIPSIALDRASFSTPEVTGSVVDVTGQGVDGVRVVLDLASTDDDADYVTTTATLNGKAGSYRFVNVTWRDDEPDSLSADTEEATVSVDDGSYEAAVPVTILLTSGQSSAAVTDLVVTRSPRTEFSAVVTGRCFHRFVTSSGVTDVAVQGVGVTVSFPTEDGEVRSLYAQTGPNGTFSVVVRWTDTSPGDFLDDVPDPAIPEGEDGLIIEVTYDGDDFADVVGAAEGVYGLDDFLVKSWLSPNYLPDAVRLVVVSGDGQ